MVANALDNYLKNLSDYDLIDSDQEIALANKIANGDESAIQELTLANLRLVVTIAKQFMNRGVALAELIAEGNHGLVKAAQRFRPGHGAKFASYAAWWIKQNIRRAIRDDKRIVRVPVQSLLRMQKIKNARLKIKQNTGKTDDHQVAKEVGISPKLVRSTSLHVDTSSFSINEQINQDGKATEKGELLPDSHSPNPGEVMEFHDGYKTLMEIVRQELNEREYSILSARFGLEDGQAKTLAETSELVGLTSERVRQLQQEALRRLRCKLAPHELQGLINRPAA